MLVRLIDRFGGERSSQKQEYVRWTLNPTAVPSPMGSNIEIAGLAKTAAGSVREGMKVVMTAIVD